MAAFVEIHSFTNKKLLVRADAIDLVEVAFTWQQPDGTIDYSGSKLDSVKIECGLLTLCTAGGHEPTTVHCVETYDDIAHMFESSYTIATLLNTRSA